MTWLDEIKDWQKKRGETIGLPCSNCEKMIPAVEFCETGFRDLAGAILMGLDHEALIRMITDYAAILRAGQFKENPCATDLP